MPVRLHDDPRLSQTHIGDSPSYKTGSTPGYIADTPSVPSGATLAVPCGMSWMAFIMFPIIAGFHVSTALIWTMILSRGIHALNCYTGHGGTTGRAAAVVVLTHRKIPKMRPAACNAPAINSQSFQETQLAR